jgi:hypothetical protein
MLMQCVIKLEAHPKLLKQGVIANQVNGLYEAVNPKGDKRLNPWQTLAIAKSAFGSRDAEDSKSGNETKVIRKNDKEPKEQPKEKKLSEEYPVGIGKALNGVGIKYGSVPKELHKTLIQANRTISELRKEHGKLTLTVAGNPKVLNDIALLTVKKPKEALKFFEACKDLQTENPELRCKGNWNPAQPGYILDEVPDGETKDNLRMLMAMFYKNKDQRESEECSPKDKKSKGKKDKQKAKSGSSLPPGLTGGADFKMTAEDQLERLSEVSSEKKK